MFFYTSVIVFQMSFQHLNVMEDMLKDFMLGEHLLLVGNQVWTKKTFQASIFFFMIYV